MTMPAGIESLARRIGELRAAELAVFESLGAWALDAESEPTDRVAFAACSHRAAWRAEQLAARAPVLAALPPSEMVAPGDDALAAATAALQRVAVGARMSATTTIGDLLAGAYAQALAEVSPTDAPSARLFARLAHDVTLGG